VRGGTFVRLNVMPFGVSMPDPATNIRVMVPGPNLGVFSSGMRQPALISQQPIVLSVQGGTFGPGTFGGSSMFSSSQFSSGPFMLWR
jgi:hypothetical protein